MATSTRRCEVGAVHVHEFMSLDGVIDAPTWTFDYGFDPKMGEAIGAVTERCRGILLGRTTYEMFEPAWSARTVEDDPGAPFFNDTTKYVVSGTLTNATWRYSRTAWLTSCTCTCTRSPAGPVRDCSPRKPRPGTCRLRPVSRTRTVWSTWPIDRRRDAERACQMVRRRSRRTRWPPPVRAGRTSYRRTCSRRCRRR